MSVEAAAHDRVKYLLTIKRNKRSPSREIAAHNPRNAQPRSTYEKNGYKPDFDKLPLEDEYKAAQEKLRNAPRP